MTMIKRVILYKHGMGYFEHEARVEGKSSLVMQFKSEDMNDVLKSLTVYDRDGGIISSISCDATRPVIEELKEIGLELPDQNVLSGMLANLKGTLVRITPIGQAAVVGTIAGLETIAIPIQDKSVNRAQLILLCEETRLSHFDLFELDKIEILDEQPQKDLGRLLETLQYWKKRDLKKMTIFTEGSGARRIHLGYTIAAPVWKTSYRILLNQTEDNTNTLQVWAHVDNTGEADWQDVQLSLVAGLPVSFVHDLYSPRKRQRPVVEIEQDAHYGAPVLQRGALIPGEPAPAMPMAKPRRAAKADLEEISELHAADDVFLEDSPISSSMQQVVEITRQKVDMADLYIYEIKHPVTVNKGQSALVPIFSGDLESNPVLLYNQGIRHNNAMNALQIKNNTGMVLEGGPITFYRSSEYLGESMMDTLKELEESILPFAVELGCKIDIDHKSDQQGIFHLEIKNGTIFTSSRIEKKTIYNINYQSGTNKQDLYLDHRFEKGYELAQDSIKPVEKTTDFLRFKMEIKPSSLNTFEVVEFSKQLNHIQLTSLDNKQLDFYISMNYLDKVVSNKLKIYIDLRSKKTALQKEQSQKDQQIQVIFDNQKRIRENLKALGDRPEERDLRQRYLNQWKEDEDRLDKMTQKIAELKKEHSQLEKEITDLQNQISYSSKIKS